MGHFSDLSIDIEEADNADTSYKSTTQKILSVGDIITTIDENGYHKGFHGTSSRSGIVKNISISMDKYDIAGDHESAVNVKSYDMELGYKGSISYEDDKGSNYWCYFHQIESIENIKDEELESDWCGTVDEDEDAVPA